MRVITALILTTLSLISYSCAVETQASDSMPKQDFPPPTQPGLQPVALTLDMRNRPTRHNQLHVPTNGEACSFSDLELPDEFVVLAVAADKGRELSFQIDQTGDPATQIDVIVNSPDQPVALMLGAVATVIWNISWLEGTEILAVAATGGGSHRQAIAGLRLGTPTLTSSAYDEGACTVFSSYSVFPSYRGAVSRRPDNLARHLFGRPTDAVYPVTDGKAIAGEPLPIGTDLVASPETPPESFYDPSAPLAGQAGIEGAVRQGILRPATAADIQAWVDAMAEKYPNEDPGFLPKPIMGRHRAYVVLKPFVYPAGLHGSRSVAFLIPEGVSLPEGNLGGASLYNFNNLTCDNHLGRSPRLCMH